VLVILLLVSPIRTSLVFNWVSFLILFLNGTVFSTIAVTLSFLAKSYTDAPRFNTYIIMPMSFLCNTFFSTDQMPHGIKEFVSALPLSQTSDMVRSIAAGGDPTVTGVLILFAYLIVFSAISFAFIYKKKNL
jgi:ABC-type polysaccharide/polyol phosphate export permease